MTSSDQPAPWGGIAVGLHDSAAALVWPDGRVEAVAEERLAGEKRRGGWPAGAVRVLGGKNPPGARWGVAWRPWSGLARRFVGGMPRLGAPRAAMLAAQLAAPARLKGPVRFLPHHLCHAASSFWTSPWDEAAVLVVDAAGEGWSTWAGEGRGWLLRRLAATPYPHSLGMLYAGVTEHLAFRADRDEGTVMGLAAHGSPSRELDASMAGLAWTEDLEIRLDLSRFAHQRRLRPILSRRSWGSLGPPRRPGDRLGRRHLALARALQRRTEEILVELARSLRRATGKRRLCLAGGVALNGPAVERVLDRSGFDEVFVPGAPHDAGAAVGAALLQASRNGGVDRDRLRREVVFPGAKVARSKVRAGLMSLGLGWNEPEDATGEVARLLARGLVVGRFRGRAELGPRALGHRSLLADPRRRRSRNRLNRLKGREWFRPVAPVMTLDEAARFLDTSQPSPFMERAVRVHPRALREIPAVVHADGTARAQTVDTLTQPGLHALLVEFGRLTGVEVLANTSFNGPGRPMVSTIEEAVLTAIDRGVDALDLEGCLVRL